MPHNTALRNVSMNHSFSCPHN